MRVLRLRREDGTYAADLDGAVDAGADGRAARRAARAAGRASPPPRRDDADRRARSRCSSTRPASAARHREAPEIDGVVHVGHDRAGGGVRRGRDRRRARARPGRRRRDRRPRGADEADDGRPGRARHAGPTPITVGRLLLSPLLFLRDPRARPRVVGRRSRCGSCCASPTASTARSPAATAPPAPARSSTRWPTRCSCSGRCSRSSRSDVFWSCRSSIIAARELVISVYRTRRRLARASACRRAGWQVQDARASSSPSGSRSGRGSPSTPTWLWTSLLWIAVVLTLVSGAQYLRRTPAERPTTPPGRRRTPRGRRCDAL